ncbi:holin [Acinetobacter sp. ANC 4636]
MAADQATLEATASAVATKVTYGGGITSAFGLIATIDWIGWVGVCVAITGLAINTYFQIKRDRREEAESRARVKSYTSKCGDD